MDILSSLRRRLFIWLERPQESRTGKIVNTALFALILGNVAMVILETVPGVHEQYRPVFLWLEAVSVAVFIAEYFTRLWVSVEDPAFKESVRGRARYAATPFAIIDLLAILPSFLAFFSVELGSLRVARLLRVVRILRLGRYFRSISILIRVIHHKRNDFIVSFVVGLFLMVTTASLMYVIEHEAQPETFSSIPQAMWWAVITLTTVGYGDVVPITPLGKLLGGIVAMLGIGMIALPASILGSGFMDEMHREKPPACPHCGKEI